MRSGPSPAARNACHWRLRIASPYALRQAISAPLMSPAARQRSIVSSAICHAGRVSASATARGATDVGDVRGAGTTAAAVAIATTSHIETGAYAFRAMGPLLSL